MAQTIASNGNLRITNSAGYTLSYPFSTCGWFKTDGPVEGTGSTFKSVFSHSQAYNQRSFWISIWSNGDVEDGKLSFKGGNQTTSTVYSNKRVDDSKWHFFAITVRGTGGGNAEVKMYIDEEYPVVFAFNNFAPSDGGGAFMEIGSEHETRYFEGDLHDIRLYKRVLSHTEINAMRDSRGMSDGILGDLVGHWLPYNDFLHGLPGDSISQYSVYKNFGGGDVLGDASVRGTSNVVADFNPSSLNDFFNRGDTSVSWTRAGNVITVVSPLHVKNSGQSINIYDKSDSNMGDRANNIQWVDFDTFSFIDDNVVDASGTLSWKDDHIISGRRKRGKSL